MNGIMSSGPPVLPVLPMDACCSPEQVCPECDGCAHESDAQSPCSGCCPDYAQPCTEGCVVVVCNDACPEGVCLDDACDDPEACQWDEWICDHEGCSKPNPPTSGWSGQPDHTWPTIAPSANWKPSAPNDWLAQTKDATEWAPGSGVVHQPEQYFGDNPQRFPDEPSSITGSHSLEASSSSSSLHHQATTHAPSSPCVCQWAGCQQSFSSMVELVTHVNLAHVPLTLPAHPLTPSTPSNAFADSQAIPCLWGDCHTSPPWIQTQEDVQNQWTPDAEFEALARHFMQEHLGLPPTVSHVHTMDCDHPNVRNRTSAILPPPLTGLAYDTTPNHLTNMTPSSSIASPMISPPPALPMISESSASEPSTPSPSGSTWVPCQWESCTQSFPNVDALTAHLTEVHVGSGHSSYECRWHDCDRHGDKAFSSKQKVLRHLQAHTGHRPFKCKQCGQFFSEAATLQQHVRRHTNEKPFVCDFPGCGKAFAITGALTIHKRTHNGEKPFKCKYCERSFSESSNLTKHLRVHTGARPYACVEPGCGKRFARPDQLSRHVTVHEKQKRAKGGPPPTTLPVGVP